MQEEGYIRTERRFGSFRRLAPFLVEVVADGAKAFF